MFPHSLFSEPGLTIVSASVFDPGAWVSESPEQTNFFYCPASKNGQESGWCWDSAGNEVSLFENENLTLWGWHDLMCECSMSVVCCYRTVADLTILHRVPYWITLWRELAGRSATKLRWGLPLQCTLLYHQVWLLSGEPACQTRHGVAHSLRCYLRQLKPQTGLHAEVTVSVILRNTNVTCGALGWHTRWLIFITTGLVRLESRRHARYGCSHWLSGWLLLWLLLSF